MSNRLNAGDPFRVRAREAGAGGQWSAPRVAGFATADLALDFAATRIAAAMERRVSMSLRVVDVAAQRCVLEFGFQAAALYVARFCSVCGCSDADACAGGCFWVGETRCSACAANKSACDANKSACDVQKSAGDEA